MNAIDELRNKLAAEQQRQQISRLWTRYFVTAICIWSVVVALPTFLIGEAAHVWGFIIYFFGISCISWWAYWQAKRQVLKSSP